MDLTSRAPTVLLDVSEATREAMGRRGLMELGSLDGHDGVLQSGSSDVKIRGDLSADAQVRGSGALLVERSVVGSTEHPCKIQMDEGVFVVGSIRQAEVVSRRIQVANGQASRL